MSGVLFCKVCGQTATAGHCSRCQKVAYCSDQHAAQDWRAGHYAVCSVQTPLDTVLMLPLPTVSRPAVFAQHLTHHQWAVLEHNRFNPAYLHRQLLQTTNGFYIASTPGSNKLQLFVRLQGKPEQRFSLKPIAAKPNNWVLRQPTPEPSGTVEQLLASTLGLAKSQDVGNFFPERAYIELVQQVRALVDTDDDSYRRVLRTEPTLQAVYMCLRPTETVPLEMHPDTVQYVQVLGGTGQATVNNEPYKIDTRHAIVIPSGSPHVLVNTHYSQNLRLITIYDSDRPEHPADLVQARQPKTEVASMLNRGAHAHANCFHKLIYDASGFIMGTSHRVEIKDSRFTSWGKVSAPVTVTLTPEQTTELCRIVYSYKGAFHPPTQADRSPGGDMGTARFIHKGLYARPKDVPELGKFLLSIDPGLAMPPGGL